jgi:hypothetical protein
VDDDDPEGKMVEHTANQKAKLKELKLIMTGYSGTKILRWRKPDRSDKLVARTAKNLALRLEDIQLGTEAEEARQLASEFGAALFVREIATTKEHETAQKMLSILDDKTCSGPGKLQMETVRFNANKAVYEESYAELIDILKVPEDDNAWNRPFFKWADAKLGQLRAFTLGELKKEQVRYSKNMLDLKVGKVDKPKADVKASERGVDLMRYCREILSLNSIDDSDPLWTNVTVLIGAVDKDTSAHMQRRINFELDAKTKFGGAIRGTNWGRQILTEYFAENVQTTAGTAVNETYNAAVQKVEAHVIESTKIQHSLAELRSWLLALQKFRIRVNAKGNRITDTSELEEALWKHWKTAK